VVLVLGVVQDNPYREIAGVIGLSPEATASRLSRAKKMFVEQYQRISQEHEGQQEKRP
jgi:RNA polymerase sigma-70 factor (ECF subfamily)